jgi:hypothetical protein
MVDVRSPRRPTRSVAALARRFAVVLGIVGGALAVAAPSWAGPMMGC